MSRFHAVRALDVATGLGPPHILDHGTSATPPRLLPHPGRPLERSRIRGDVYPEWLRTPEGLWVPAIAGGVGVVGEYQKPALPFPGDYVFGDTGGVTSHALDAAYTFNSAGDAVAARSVLSTTKTLSSVYYFVVSSTGSPAALNLEIGRNDTSTTPVTGFTSLGTQTDTPSLTANRWNKKSWSVSNIGGHATDRYFWTLIGDADGSGTDRWTLGRYLSSVGPTNFAARAHKSFITTGGFASAITDDVQLSMIVLIFSDGTAQGWPFSNTASTAAGTEARGLRVSTGFTSPLRVYGYRFSASSGTPITPQMWEGTGGPSAGTDVLSGVNAKAIETGYIIFPAATIDANTPYRFTVTGGGFNGLRRFVMGTLASGTAAELMAAALFGGNAFYTEEVTGAWVDTTTDLTEWAWLVEDQVATAGGQAILTPPTA